jgi:hypothetical protein
VTTAFVDFLNETKPDADTVQHALRLFVSERSNDEPPDGLRRTLHAASSDPTLLQETLTELQRNDRMVEAAALAILCDAWEESDNAEQICAAFDNAKRKLPVIETAIVALVAMYGMYLAVTRGKKKRTIRRKPDGSFEEIDEWADPTSWVSPFRTLFGGKKRG